MRSNIVEGLIASPRMHAEQQAQAQDALLNFTRHKRAGASIKLAPFMPLLFKMQLAAFAAVKASIISWHVLP